MKNIEKLKKKEKKKENWSENANWDILNSVFWDWLLSKGLKTNLHEDDQIYQPVTGLLVFDSLHMEKIKIASLA